MIKYKHEHLITAMMSLGITSEELLRQLDADVKDISFKKGEKAVNIGELTSDIYYVHKGLFKLVYHDCKGRDLINNFVPVGRFAGSFTNILDENESIFNVEAVTDSEVTIMPYSWFSEHASANLEVALAHSIYMEYLWKLNERQIISLQSQGAKEKYIFFTEEFPGITEIVPQRQVAAYLGISEVTLSRLKKSL